MDAVVALAAVLLSVVAVAGALVQPAAAGPISGVATWEAAVVGLPNGAIAFDAARDVVLVAVAPSVPTLGNHLVELDPQTGALGRSVAVGADPSVVAVADDGSRAYVGGYGSSYVTEVDLASFTVTRRIFLGNDERSGGYYAEDIEVQPGHPSVIAVSLSNLGISPGHEGVAIYDAGVRRPAATPDHSGANRITWSDDPATLYGYNNETSGHEFYVLTVGAGGVTATSPGPIVEGSNVDIEHADGEVVATNGQVVDTETLTLAGAYTTHGVVEVDEARDVAYFLDDATLTSHDPVTKLLSGSRTVPDVAATQLVDAGTTLVASGRSAILLLGEGVTASGFALPPPPASRVLAADAVSIPLAVEELAASPGGEHVYGVVRQAAAELPGRVVEISTVTREVTRSLFVGADPNHIGISPDGSTLLVAHASANRLTEVATDDLSIRRTIALASGEWAIDIAARPATSATFAVVLAEACCYSAQQGLILVQDGVVLPSRAPVFDGVTSATFASEPDRLYGVNGGTTDFGFHTLQADADGLRPLSSVRRLSRRLGAQVVASEDLAYSTNGQVFDPTVPSVIGTMPPGQVVPVPAGERLIVVAGSSIQELDLDTLGTVATTSFTGGEARHAVAAGAHVAIATTSGQVVLVPLAIARPTVTALAPTTGTPWGGTSITITGTGLRGAIAVRFGTTAATAFTVESDTEITAVAPPHEPGDVDVTVTTPGGTSAAGTSRYTYDWPPRSSAESWVWAAYEDFLGRTPTQAEVSAAKERLADGVPRSTLARELANSREWVDHIVTRFYTDTLGRTPSEQEVAYWSAELRSRRRTVAQVAASFYASPEYFAGRGGRTTASWVRDLYERVLGRTPPPEDVAYWSGRVQARGRTWVALQIFQSQESRRARVAALYQALLGRAPDAPGWEFWVTRLRSEGDIALARQLASSGEYLARAETRFP